LRAKAHAKATIAATADLLLRPATKALFQKVWPPAMVAIGLELTAAWTSYVIFSANKAIRLDMPSLQFELNYIGAL